MLICDRHSLHIQFFFVPYTPKRITLFLVYRNKLLFEKIDIKLELFPNCLSLLIELNGKFYWYVFLFVFWSWYVYLSIFEVQNAIEMQFLRATSTTLLFRNNHWRKNMKRFWLRLPPPIFISEKVFSYEVLILEMNECQKSQRSYFL